MSKRKQIQKHYGPRISPGRANFDVLDWADAESQLARFGVLVKNVDLEGKMLLDIGSGLGDLLAFLKQRGISADYTGVDLLDKMVAAARQRRPEGRFDQADVFTKNIFKPKSFDVVFCSGIFNLSLGNNLQFLPVAVGSMLALAREHMVFNLLHNRAPQQERGYFYYDPAVVRSMLEPFGCEVSIIDDYLPNDFTVICRI